jgi:putative ABC transport system permease protein
VFSVFDRLMFRPLPYADPDRLVHLRQVTLPAFDGSPASSNIMGEVSLAIAKYGRSFTGVGWAQGGGLRTAPWPGAPPLALTVATRNIVDVLGIQPELGRPFRDDDVADPSVRSVMLTHEAWARWFGGSEQVLNVTWKEGFTYRIVGVLPPGFLLPSSRFMEECDGLFAAPPSAAELNAIPGARAVGAVEPVLGLRLR